MYLPGFNLEYHPLPTPDTAPGSYVERTYRVPNDPLWLGLLNGVISLLFYPEFWVQVGSATVEEVTQVFQEMYVADQEPEGNGMITGFIYTLVLESPTEGLILCDGSIQTREDYPLLYAALNDNFIKDEDEFWLPNLMGRAMIGAGTGWQMTPREVGQRGGEEEHTLTRAEMPTHDHIYDRVTENVGGELRMGSGYDYYDNIGAISTGTGGGDPHENMMPFGVVQMYIYTDDRP